MAVEGPASYDPRRRLKLHNLHLSHSGHVAGDFLSLGEVCRPSDVITPPAPSSLEMVTMAMARPWSSADAEVSAEDERGQAA